MSTDSISDLETAMYEALDPGKPQIKVAMLVARTFGDCELAADDTINIALERLASRADIQSFGLINRWRHSEIKRLADATGS
ncbi:hypothetical protein JQT66_17480 [Sulfitobacter mediterraneus]|uniref:hypothetical protein n=1 Tax=Sulfitobacter mediterraneus TaxID=83219 RepID=UPI0019339A18|nr:hypothetical protein [Sulfitobacter mediterraneus]MBM1312035.1 hypothetical protein [Sulfitobacter mediterraneus]MBM1315915.1 hypothetical protein [Sulfitobacter mediterraneus]MBM1324278.1 hypothetical protein [Sulfitobacter mediterraneus]MBM1328189.1 hypothetical protein [Sulfitobacter mediterraneus]MBM1399538.1 hypothetical protein [Sulfitobacter mediterraneus]